jgi:hypothetical protein
MGARLLAGTGINSLRPGTGSERRSAGPDRKPRIARIEKSLRLRNHPATLATSGWEESTCLMH